MTNLRIIKKRDGSQILMWCYCDELRNEAHRLGGDCHLRDIPIVEEPEPEKELAEVLLKKYSEFGSTWEEVAQAAEAWFRSHGWKEPDK